MGKKITIRIRDPDGMNIPDHISESLETLFWFNLLKLFDADAHPDPGIFVTLNPRSGIRDKHSGYAIMLFSFWYCSLSP
jgi:hypothetical protein